MDTMAIIAIIVLLAVACVLYQKGKNTVRNDNEDEYGIFYQSGINNSDGRTLNGRPLQSKEDWDRWWILKGFSDGYLRRLSEIEQAFSDPLQPDPSALLSEWQRRYDAYKSLCKQHGMWNFLLDDHVPYIPTQAQLRLEEILYKKTEQLFREGLAERELYLQYQDQILSYLLTFPGHKAPRKKLFQHFQQEDAEANKQFRKIYKKLIANKVLLEKKNENAAYYVRKAPARKPKETQEISLPPSTFNEWQYAALDRKMLYKVEYTVDPPLSVDRNANTCVFISKTSGEKYHTSLNMCTCPVYDAEYQHPCKHMLALALHLGYISKRDKRFR